MTGGTIDSHYDGAQDTVVTNKKSIVPPLMKSIRLVVPCMFTTICMKDSRRLAKNNIRRMLVAIEKSSATKIIVTHGTYTMPDSARYIEAHLKRKDQTVIFTGSFIPIVGFAPSDGSFNLGFAIGQVGMLQPGVYVSMNGRSYRPHEVLKNLRAGKFESIFSI